MILVNIKMEKSRINGSQWSGEDLYIYIYV